jgi:hypothetical protein
MLSQKQNCLSSNFYQLIAKWIKHCKYTVMQLQKTTHHHQSSDKETYGWLTSYNFICLLNLPTVMERYGPITNLWEGGMMGEKFSQELKPRLRGGLTRNWHVNVLKDVLKVDVLSRMELPTATPEVKQPVSYIRDCRYVKYKMTLDVITKYNERQPIAVVNFENNIWGCIIGGHDRYLQVNINGIAKIQMGLHY